MITVYKNADFITLNSQGDICSVMVVNSRKIAYVGYNTPICYDSERVVDLNGACVIPLINDMVYYDISHAHCKVLQEGERADFIVLDKNVLKENNPKILAVYKKGKKRL